MPLLLFSFYYSVLQNPQIVVHQTTMQIYVGTYEGSLIVLQTDPTQIKPLKQLQISSNSIKSLCAINSTFLIAGGFDQELRVIDLNTYQQKVQAKENLGQITKIAQVNDRLFVIGVEDGSIRLWNSNTWSMTTQARFHKKSVSSIVVSKEGKLMISAGGNKIIIWSAQTLKKAHQYKFGKDIFIEHLRMTEDMKFIYYATSKNELWKICTQNNEQSIVIKMPSPRKIQDFVLFLNFVVLANDIGQAMALPLDYQSANHQEPQNFDNRIWFKAHNSRIKEIKIVNQEYLIIATAAGNISVWDFPQFLKSVDHISQSYNLEGLTSICEIQVKGRILCLDAITKHVNNSQNEGDIKQEKEQQIQKQEDQQLGKQTIQVSKKKKIKKDRNKNATINKDTNTPQNKKRIASIKAGKNKFNKK